MFSQPQAGPYDEQFPWRPRRHEVGADWPRIERKPVDDTQPENERVKAETDSMEDQPDLLASQTENLGAQLAQIKFRVQNQGRTGNR